MFASLFDQFGSECLSLSLSKNKICNYIGINLPKTEGNLTRGI